MHSHFLHAEIYGKAMVYYCMNNDSGQYLSICFTQSSDTVWNKIYIFMVFFFNYYLLLGCS